MAYLVLFLDHLLSGIIDGGLSFISSTDNFVQWIHDAIVDAFIDFIAFLLVA